MKSCEVHRIIYNFIFCQNRLFLTTKIVQIYKFRPESAGQGAINKKVQNSMISIDTKGTIRRINLFNFVQQAISAKYIVKNRKFNFLRNAKR